MRASERNAAAAEEMQAMQEHMRMQEAKMEEQNQMLAANKQQASAWLNSEKANQEMQAMREEMKQSELRYMEQQMQEVQFGNMKLAYVERRSGWSHNYKDPKARDLAHEAVKYECAMMIGLWEMKLETVAALPYWFEAQASAAPLYGSFGKRIFSTYLS